MKQIMLTGSTAAIMAAMLAFDNANGATVTVDDNGDDDNVAVPLNTAAPTLDSTGCPWDAEIHSSKKTLTASGAWQRRKGVSQPQHDAKAAQLRASIQSGGTGIVPAGMQQPAPQPMPMPGQPMMPPQVQQPAPQPMPMPGQPMMPQPVPQPVYQQPVPQPMPEPTPAPQPAPTGPDFPSMMQHIATKSQIIGADGLPLINPDYLARITAEISQAFAAYIPEPLKAFTDIQSQPNMITYAIQLFQRDGRW